MEPPRPRASAAEATLSAFAPPVRDVLVPILLYKSVFLGDWFEALLRQEREKEVRAALAAIGRDTLREAIEAIDVMRPWQDIATDPARMDPVVETLQRRVLHDLLVIKEGSNEAVLFAAMHAPTDELRRRLVRLADLDRVHADALRALLGADAARDLRPPAGDDEPLGARTGRAGAGTLAQSVRADIKRIHAGGGRAVRLVVSPAALRHLRDEGQVGPDGTAFGLPIDVDFAWAGECHAFITDERIRLAELLSREGAEPQV